jgi:hypothetical protein
MELGVLHEEDEMTNAGRREGREVGFQVASVDEAGIADRYAVLPREERQPQQAGTAVAEVVRIEPVDAQRRIQGVGHPS